MTKNLSSDIFEDDEDEALVNTTMLFEELDAQDKLMDYASDKKSNVQPESLNEVGNALKKRISILFDEMTNFESDNEKLDSQDKLMDYESDKKSCVQPESSNEVSNVINKRTTTLFDEMTSFDSDNGKLNLSNSTRSVLLHDSNHTTDEKSFTKCEVATELNEPINKKKIEKKITDYFKKKPI